MTNKRLLSTTALLALSICLSAQPTSAQGSVADILSFLMTNQAVVTDDFVKDQQAAAATRDTVFRFLQVALGTLPVTSSTGGFIYRFNPMIGTMERASDSFGPFFLERAITSGRRQTSVGVTYRHSRFDTLDGRSLHDGTLVTIANTLANEPDPFDVEVLRLRIEADTFTLLGNYGVSDRLDIGAALPIIHLRLSGERLNFYRGSVFQQAIGSALVTGLADVAFRAKYNLVQGEGFGVAAGADLRLPTGSQEHLLGAARAAIHLSAIASIERGRIGSHVKAGYGKGGVSDALDYGGAVVLSASPRLNLVAEVFGQRLSALTRIGEVTAPHPLIPNVSTTRLSSVTIGTNTVLALAGAKWNLGRTWLLSANVLLTLTDTGLTGRPTPSIALDYTFDRR
jgi:hypothetical protein